MALCKSSIFTFMGWNEAFSTVSEVLDEFLKKQLHPVKLCMLLFYISLQITHMPIQEVDFCL